MRSKVIKPNRRPHRGQISVEKTSGQIFRAVGTEHRMYQRNAVCLVAYLRHAISFLYFFYRYFAPTEQG